MVIESGKTIKSQRAGPELVKWAMSFLIAKLTKFSFREIAFLVFETLWEISLIQHAWRVIDHLSFPLCYSNV
jgi:hypothetical protein